MRHFLQDVRRVVREIRFGRTGVSGSSRRDPVPDREPEELRVMTFNVRGASHPDGKNAWSRRAALNVDVIRRWKPDVIGFQEFQRGNLKTYEQYLPDYGKHLGPKYENRPPHSFNAVFWDKERVELLEKTGFWLSETPEKFSRSWRTSQIRSANLLRFRLIPEGREFLFLNTHLDHRSVEARKNGARLITRKLEDRRDLPTVVTGDFNARPGKPVYRTFTDARFNDAHVLCKNPKTSTFHRFEGEHFGNDPQSDPQSNPQKEIRMDWILLRNTDAAAWKPLACNVIRDCDPPVFPSDHYPVTARLLLV